MEQSRERGSVGGDHENGGRGELIENVGLDRGIPIIPPDHPDPSTIRGFGIHLERAVAALVKAENPVKRGFHFGWAQGMGIDLVDVPLDPFECPAHRSLLHATSESHANPSGLKGIVSAP